ncbi:hypothetical protein BCR39DRAFT_371854 [Naematelia encephala]|uniref:Short-chain dehydrogenase/reductase SDR n=1 Tax=Naematelia encephala TaxID=71784 RepID=A0A1Y2AJP2_9TREE|nr:hypothetical protein BCR39DRAFT_371854 [Naematelia encephala]
MSTPPRVILITGASSGIGRTSAIAVSNAFPSTSNPEPLVLILSGRRESELKETASRCREGTVTEICVGDVSKDADVEKMFKTIKDKYGRLDVLFNNAGIDLLNSVPLEEADMDKFRQVLDVNVMAAVLCTQGAIKLMKDQSPQGGRIINNGSISASSPRPNSAAYTVSKHAILGLSRSTSLDGRKYLITCTQLDIGNAQTAMGGHAAKGSRQADGSMRPEPMMDVSNVGKTIVFLCALDPGADVLSMEVIARGMPYVGRG